MGLVREFRDFVTSFSFPDNFLGFWGSAPSEAGVTVNEMSALQSAAIAGCVRIISGLLASLPLNVYEKTKSGRRVAYDHALQYLLNQQPNPETDAFIFKETLQTHLLLNGNCYAELVYDNGGRIAALYQRSPWRTFPYRKGTGELIFKTTDGTQSGTERSIDASEIVHVKGLSLDGLVGLNPIKSFAREVVGLDLGSRAFGARLFANNASPSGVVSTDKILKDEHRKKLEQSWIAGHSGSQAHKFAVLDGGLKWQSISLSPEESQFLLTRAYQRSEIAAIYGVPPHLLGDREETRANIEQQMLQFLAFTLKPWLRRWEAALSMKLLPTVGRTAGKYEIAFDTSEMERGDYETMLKGLSVGRQWGLYSANEAREILRLNPFDAPSEDAADQLWMPVNMQVARDADEEAPQPQQQQPEPQTEEPEQQKPEDDDIKRAISTYSRVFRDAFGRILVRDKADSKAFARAFTAPLFGLCDLIYMDADPTFSTGSVIPDEVAGFVSDYIGGMQRRAKDWTAETADKHSCAELERAVRAIKIAVYREVATRKAKESTSEPETRD